MCAATTTRTVTSQATWCSTPTSAYQECETIVDPLDSLRRKRLGGKRFETLLAPLARNGKTVLAPKFRDALAARERAREGLATLDESQKRMLNPHSYPVGLEHGLFERRSDLVAKLRGFE